MKVDILFIHTTNVWNSEMVVLPYLYVCINIVVCCVGARISDVHMAGWWSCESSFSHVHTPFMACTITTTKSDKVEMRACVQVSVSPYRPNNFYEVKKHVLTLNKI